jgi:hypothetical protein
VSIYTANDTISRTVRRWADNTKRSSVARVAVPQQTRAAIPTVDPVSWPGSGSVRTCTSDVPVILVQGMPVSEYPCYVKELVRFTVAHMMCQTPELIPARASTAFLHAVTITVSVRAGAWAAMGRAPPASAGVSIPAIRWSERRKGLVMRNPLVGDGTALWRHFLATSPGHLAGAQLINQALCGVAPMLFLMGCNLLHSTGEAYAMQYVQKEVHLMLEQRLPAFVLPSLKLDSACTWDTLIAASLDGFTMSATKSFCRDGAFMTGAQMRLTNNATARRLMQAKLDRMLSRQPAVGLCSPVQERNDSSGDDIYRPTEAEADVDDVASVADTEVSLGRQSRVAFDDRPARGRSPSPTGSLIPPKFDDLPDREGTPRPRVPSMSSDDANAIRGAARHMAQNAVHAASEGMGANPDETVVW